MPVAYKAVFALTSVVIGALYLWCALAANEPFDFDHDKNGFYDFLGRAFAGGHLYVPIQPAPELLALADPWDPKQNAPFAFQDLVLYNRRYYVYHGVTPALILFAPWRILTRRDLSEPIGAVLFCFLGYLFTCGILMRFLEWMNARPPLPLFALILVALGVCQSAPYLLQRVYAYEIAISGGYLCVSAGFWFLTVALMPTPTPSTATISTALRPLVLSGLVLGLAVGCRPSLIFAPIFAGLAFAWYLRGETPLSAVVRSRELWAFAIPVITCGLMLAAYNYARFLDPFEFGMRYEMAESVYQRPTLSLQNLLPGLYYLLAAAPDFDRVFPFVRLVFRMPFEFLHSALPSRYFLEPIAGMLTMWPLGVVALAGPGILRGLPDRSARAVAGAMYFSAMASIVFISLLGLVSHRFEVDFLPYFVLLSCIFMCAATPSAKPSRSPRWITAARAAAVLAVIYSIAANLALGIQGPYDKFVQLHPRAYARLAGWFSPVPRFRPLHNPKVTIEAFYQFPRQSVSGPVPLISAGRYGSRYLLSGEMQPGGKLRLVSASSRASAKTASAEVTITPGALNRVRLDYQPEPASMLVYWNGEMVLRHDLPFLLTAASQVLAGEDRTDLGPPSYFPGRVWVASKVINGVNDP